MSRLKTSVRIATILSSSFPSIFDALGSGAGQGGHVLVGDSRPKPVAALGRQAHSEHSAKAFRKLTVIDKFKHGAGERSDLEPGQRAG